MILSLSRRRLLYIFGITSTSTSTTSSLLSQFQLVSSLSSSSFNSQHTCNNNNNNNNMECNTNIQHLPQKYPIGFGTYLIERDNVQQAIQSAIKVGYRRIDCAPVYFNEDVIGDALTSILQDGLVQRSDLYITSKLPSPFHTNVELAIRKTLYDLQLDYLDLYLIHWPVAFFPVPLDPTKRGYDNEDIDDSNNGLNIDTNVSIHDTWKQMEKVYEMGLVRSIGVSNFPVMLLHELLSKATIKPVVNQCESHPYLQQTKLINYCNKRGIHFQGYSTLGTPGYKESNEPNVLNDPVIQKIAKTHSVSAAQVCIAWALQRNISVVVKSINEIHQNDNLIIKNINEEPSLILSNDEMNEINTLDRGYRFFRPEEWWGELGMAVFD